LVSTLAPKVYETRTFPRVWREEPRSLPGREKGGVALTPQREVDRHRHSFEAGSGGASSATADPGSGGRGAAIVRAERVRPEDLGIGELFERVRDAVIVADARTQRIVLWNPAAERIFGYSPFEVFGMAVEELVPEHLKARHRAGIVRYGETGSGPYIDSEALLDLPAVCKDGEEIAVEMSLSPIGPADGGGRFVLAIIRDATERARAEETRSRLAAVVESADDAIIGKTLEGTITSWNSGAQRIYGYTAEEIVGRPITILVPPDRPNDVPEILRKVRQGEKVDHYDTVRVRKDGRRIYISLTVSPIKDAEGSVIGASAVARDVTERRLFEEKLQRLNETLEARVAERTAQLAEREAQLRDLVGKLIAAQEEERRRVAYEVHDGLTQTAAAAHLYLQAFSEDHPPATATGRAELNRALGLVRKTVVEARHVIEGLRPAALDDFGLATAIRLEVERLRSEGWHVDYEDDLGDERLPAEIEMALFRVAQEALTNARKHAQTDRARVALARRGKTIRLEVRDEGRGFDPSSPTRNGPGERVGLAGMRERVALLGGELKIHSRPGAGTRAIAEVPLPEEPETGRAT
jgi:PAS domain S-box-containing protein